jgi:hypothetical protein
LTYLESRASIVAVAADGGPDGGHDRPPAVGGGHLEPID